MMGCCLSSEKKEKTGDAASKCAHLDYFHGQLPEEDATRLLVNDGDFLLRLSGDELKLAVCWKNAPGGIIELTVRENRRGEYRIGDSNHYPSIADLIAFYRTRRQPLPIRDRPVLAQPVFRQQWELRRSDIHLGKQIGEGAFGTVFLGRLTCGGVLERASMEVAVKLLLHEESRKSAEEMMLEARAMQGMEHPNVVKLYGVSLTETPFMLVMEFVTGGSVDVLLTDKGKNITAIARVLMCEQAARGLCFLHGLGCLHRDIAARNLLVHDATIKVADFGLARITEHYKIDLRKPTNVRWLAPEVWKSAKITKEVDVYAFGITMWEMFQRPFADPFADWEAEQVRQRVMKGARPKPWGLAPVEMCEAINRCWHQEADKRPSFAELLQLIKPLLPPDVHKCKSFDDKQFVKIEERETAKKEADRKQREGY